MRTIVITVLRGIGLTRIVEANDGALALDELRTRQFDFMITDFAMPTLDGVELAQMLRRAPDSPAPRLPIIMMTAHTEKSRITAARDAGIDEIMSKPLSADTILSRVVNVIDRPREWITTKSFVGPCRRRHDGDVKYAGPRRRADDQAFDLDWSVA